MLARQLGTDRGATSASQMTRLPGSVNHKDPTRPSVTGDHRDAERVPTPSSFPHPPDPVAIPMVEPRMKAADRATTMSVLERARAI